jgi:hypothetical protein
VQTARKKSPATAERIISMALGTGDGLKGVRDRALLLLGFAGAFRRSESLPLSPRENHAPRLGDPNPCDFECAAASDHAFRLCCRQPRTDQFVQLSNREAVHQHDRFGAAVGARGKEFQRAPAVGLGAAPAAWAWHLIFLRIRPFQIESVRFELRFCFFEARRVTIHCMAGRETGSTDDAWERHGLFRCGAFIAARSHRPSINIRKGPPNIWHQL